MLPDIKIKLKTIMERKKVADSLRDEIERFSLVGFEVPEARQKTDQLDFIVKDLMSNIRSSKTWASSSGTSIPVSWTFLRRGSARSSTSAGSTVSRASSSGTRRTRALRAGSR